MSALKPRHVLAAVIAFGLVVGVINQGTTASDAVQGPKATMGNKTKTGSGTTTTTSTSVRSTTTSTPPQSVAPSTAVPSTTTPGTVYTPPQSVAADCSSDVAPALYTWIAGLPNGTATSPTVVSFPSTACYRVEETIPIWQQSWISIQGNGAKFEALTNGTGSPYIGIDYGEAGGTHYPYYLVQNFTGGSDPNNSRAFMLIDDSRNIVVNGVRFVGPNTCTDVPYFNCYNAGLESQAGFIVSGGSNISLSNDTISQVWGDCAQVGAFSADAGGWLNGWTFTNNHCDHLARHGWSSNEGENLTVTGNTFTQVAYDAMDMEDDGQTATNPVGCATGCSGAGWANVNESGNTFTGASYFSIAVQCGSNCTAENIAIRNNQFSTLDGPEITVYGIAPDPYVQNISIVGNTWTSAFDSSYVDSINLRLVNGGLISGNTIPQECYDWSSNGAIPCGPTGPHTYQQPVAISIEGSNNVAVQNNKVDEAGQVLEIDGNNNGQSKWSGTASSQITQCGNVYGPAVGPTSQPPC